MAAAVVAAATAAAVADAVAATAAALIARLAGKSFDTSPLTLDEKALLAKNKFMPGALQIFQYKARSVNNQAAYKGST